MPRRQTHIEGGKVKSLKRIGKDINKGFTKATKGMAKAGAELGKFTNEQLLPAVVSAGIPLASTALGVVGQEFGLPPELTSSLSENLMKGYIPKQYQSENKYVNLFGDALNMAVSGDADPYAMMQLQQGLTGALSEDLGGKPKIKAPLPSRQAYNPDNPYQDLMLQMMGNYMPLASNIQQGNYMPQTTQQPVNDPNDDLDARYGDSELGQGADSIRITKPPYQQREGNVDALLGGGMKKKRRGRPKKIVIEENIEIYTKKKPAYKKFSHAKNTALDQLLEAKEEREGKEAKEAMKKLVEKQTKALTALGFGFKKSIEKTSFSKPLKGSKEAKEHMAKLRAMRKN